ncbi:MAG: thermonuclease family protein [Actinomycetota bacterium]|nr:thermonuclease family protein [Actinomycetota bacterium]
MLRRFLPMLIFVACLAVFGCAPPDSQGGGVGDKQRAEKAGKDGASEQRSFDPKAGADDEKDKPEASTSDDPTDEPDPAPAAAGPAPEKVLASQYRHINSGDYGAAYDLFDDGSRELVPLERYEAYFQSEAPYEITSYSFPSAQVRGDTASVVADLSVSSSDGEEGYQVTQELVREDGSWRVVMRDEQVASFAASDSGSSASASATAEPQGSGGDYDETVTVSRVVDGDTIEISPAVGGVTDVRLIGVDTPETVDPGEEVEPYGPESSDFATGELTGRSVGLEFGAERTDQYDRLLAYIYVGGEMFNEVLVEEGYAQAYPYEPNTEYEGRFAEAQEEAKASGLGIWGLPLAKQCLLANHGNGIGEGSPGCGESSASPSASASASASASPSASSPAPGGGGGLPSGGGDIDCDQVDGPIPTPPGDPDGLDGDGDGLACE